MQPSPRSFKIDLSATYIGQAWCALMGYAFIPVYIRILGVEGYGLIGIAALLQTWLTTVDLGMTPTIAREMASFRAGKRPVSEIRDLLRTYETIVGVIGVTAGLAVWALSGYFGSAWLKTTSLRSEEVATILSLIAVVVGLRFCESVYRSALQGLRTHTLLSVLQSTLATLRHAGAAASIVYVSQTAYAFFLWQVISSVVSLFVLAAAVHLTLPSAGRQAKFSWRVFGSTWTFARGMAGISILALAYSETDKVILSGLLTLEEFGRYALASSIAAILYMVVTPVAQTAYPRLVEAVSQQREASVAKLFHTCAQLVTVLTVPLALVLCMHGEVILLIWSGDHTLASKAAPIVAGLTVAAFANSSMWIPYNLQLAHGLTSLRIRLNAMGLILLVPLALLVIPRAGAIGAAWVCAVLTIGMAAANAFFMHQKILQSEGRRWVFFDVLAPTLAAATIVVGAGPLLAATQGNKLTSLLVLGGASMASLVAAAMVADRVRFHIHMLIRGAFLPLLAAAKHSR